MTAAALPMRVFTGRVVRTEELTRAMRRIVLGGDGLAGYASTGVGDEYVRLIFPAPGATEPVLPAVTGGVLDYGSIDLATMRTYTVRDFDPVRGEVTIDFVVHDGGVAAEWARAARPGDRVGINTPDGMYAPPPGLRWQILVTDCAGLPAAARLLETTGAAVRTRLVAEVPDEDHYLRLDVPAGAEVTWVHGGNGHGPSRLEDIVRSLPRPEPGVGYLWVAGETRALRGVRKYLRKELGLPAEAYKTVGYWTDGAERWRARYAALDAEIRTSLEALWTTADADLADIEIQYDERLARLGL
jgi:NADPH-dependent ferric siderophore reductase